MFSFLNRDEKPLLYRVVMTITMISFFLNSAAPGMAQVAPMMPLAAPGTMILPTSAYVPPMINGITIYPDNPLQFDFIINNGDENLEGEALKAESLRLIKYFLTTLTVPEKDLWVNLSPYEKDRIIPDQFSQTEMGRDLLAEDYILKQLTASLMYPENDLGKAFWDRVYQKAREQFGTAEIPMDTFNKIWIIPDSAQLVQNGNTIYVLENHLKVMLEQDYAALQESRGGSASIDTENISALNELSSSIVREILIPEIEREVNEGKNFAQLRQIFNSAILAAWYKLHMKESLLGQVYVDQNKIKGVEHEDPAAKERIYNQYVEAFKQGVFDFIKEDVDPVTHDYIARRYVSGGTKITYPELTPVGTDTLSPEEKRELAEKAGGNTVSVNLLEDRPNQDGLSSPIDAVLPRVNPTTTTSWEQLRQLATTQTYDLRTLFTENPNRAEDLRVALSPEFEVDFSKNLIDDETLQTLLTLANEVGLQEAIEQMFTGAKINETENRAVLHTALRNIKRGADGKLVAANGPVFVDGKDVMPGVIEVLEHIEEFTNKLHSGEWRGASGEEIEAMINIGIGGSDLGPKMGVEALRPFKIGNIEVYFLSNVDGTAAAELMKKLNPKKTIVNVVSKTFTTQEMPIQ